MADEAELVRLQYELRDHMQLNERRHSEICESIAKIELALVTILECITEHRTFTEHEEEIEEEVEPPIEETETEEHSEEEETSEERITEVEPEHLETVVEATEEILVEDAMENLNDIPFGR